MMRLIFALEDTCSLWRLFWSHHGVDKNALRAKNILKGNKKYTGSRVDVCIKMFLCHILQTPGFAKH